VHYIHEFSSSKQARVIVGLFIVVVTATRRLLLLTSAGPWLTWLGLLRSSNGCLQGGFVIVET